MKEYELLVNMKSDEIDATKLSRRSHKCAEAILAFLSNHSDGVDTSIFYEHLKALGFGEQSVGKAKEYLLLSGKIIKIGRRGFPYRWYSRDFAPRLSTGQAERNGRSLCEIYAKFPQESKWGKDGYFVYIFKRDRDEIIKIGTTLNIAERAKSVTYACGSTVSLVGHMDCHSKEQATYIEWRIHTLFDHQNIIGEWFHIDSLPCIEEIIEEIISER